MRRKNVHSSAPPPAKYGNTLIPETYIYKHLGIMQSSNGKLPNDVDALKCKIWGTFLSITGKVFRTSSSEPEHSTETLLRMRASKNYIRLRVVEKSYVLRHPAARDGPQLLSKKTKSTISHTVRHGKRPFRKHVVKREYRHTKAYVLWFTMSIVRTRYCPAVASGKTLPT